ncbi:MAG: PfkB family carbohydrate kinase [Planctomycetes bacterium]|nr:PfkB family carbohydrate kinase [Planctomycetota bacterium]
MSITVVGSIAFDSIETPHGKVERVLGGSSSYFAIAASNFADVNLVGIVGDDFDQRHLELFKERGIDISGIEHSSGKTFAWSGAYEAGSLDSAITREVHINVLGEYSPKLAEKHASAEYIFLANGHPALQKSIRGQCTKAKFVMLDTMNLWIETARDDLMNVLKDVDCLVLNEGEALLLTEHHNLVAAGYELLELGLEYVLLKKGQHGSMLFTKNDFFALPSYPLRVVKDPTGAGDSFGGAFLGQLARSKDLSFESMKLAVMYATVTASFTVEEFGVDNIRDLSFEIIESRATKYRKMVTIP